MVARTAEGQVETGVYTEFISFEIVFGSCTLENTFFHVYFIVPGRRPP